MAASGDLISVVIPARNAAPYIARTLASVQRQTHRNLEIIAVDDGSDDPTPSIVEAEAKSDPRIKLLRLSGRGASAARNTGIAKASAELIATIDADDLWAPDKLARQYSVLASAPEIGVAYCWSAGIDARDRIVLPVWNGSRATGNVLRDIVISGILSNGSTPLFRKSAFEAAGGYDEQLLLCEDWKFYTALAGVTRFALVPECLTGYRLRDDSLSVNPIAMEQAIAKVTLWIRRTWPQLPESVYRERDFTVNHYLAFLAIRAREYASAVRYLGHAARAKPMATIDGSLAQLALLAALHRGGLRRYDWRLWRKPRLFPGAG